jgi:hypothetical protein
VAKLAKHTVEQSRKTFQSLQDSKSDRSAKLKEKFLSKLNWQTILSQTQQKLQGNTSIAERIVSFYDSQVRPIPKGN